MCGHAPQLVKIAKKDKTEVESSSRQWRGQSCHTRQTSAPDRGKLELKGQESEMGVLLSGVRKSGVGMQAEK